MKKKMTKTRAKILAMKIIALNVETIIDCCDFSNYDEESKNLIIQYMDKISEEMQDRASKMELKINKIK